MAFDEIELPSQFSRGTQFGPAFATTVVRSASGVEQRNQLWQTALHRGTVGYNIKTVAAYEALLAFFFARAGRARGFRFKNWLDYQSGSSAQGVVPTKLDQPLGTGNGATTVFQIAKLYVSGAVTYTRTILKPVSSTILIAVAGTLKTEGADYTIDYTTGLVTFAAAPASGAALTWGGQFRVPVRFDADEMPASFDSIASRSWSGVPIVEMLSPS